MEQSYYLHTLSNGLRIALLPAKRSRAVYCGFAIKTGSRDDTPSREGEAHFVEHMLFKGTQKRSPWHILNRMELVGGELNAYTTKDETYYYTTAPRNELVRSMELLNDLVRHATFPPEEIEKERTVIFDEINLYKDTPSDQLFDDWDALYFQGTPLAHPILGSPKSLKGITSEHLQRYSRRCFRPERMIFFCMGSVSPQKFISLAEKYLCEPFPALSESDLFRRPLFSSQLHHNPVLGVHYLPKKTHQAHTIVGGPSFSIHSSKQTEVAFLINMLAGPTMNSLLNLSLRERNGWVYSVEGSSTMTEDIGWWNIYFGGDHTNTQKALDVISLEFQRLRENQLSNRTLKAWVKQIKGQLTLSSENQESSFLSFGRQILQRHHYDTLPECYLLLDQLTPERVKDVASEIFDPQKLLSLSFSNGGS